MSKKPIIFILGPTAVGKSNLAIELAKNFAIDIISVDSVMVYKDCNIGSAKPSKKILKEFPHKLVDHISPNKIYTVSSFYKEANEFIKNSHKNKKIPIFVGGTMMYFKILLDGLNKLPPGDNNLRKYLSGLMNDDKNYLHSMLEKKDPIQAKKIKPNDKKRIIRSLEIIENTGQKASLLLDEDTVFLKEKYNVVQYGIEEKDRKSLHRNIEIRLIEIIEKGLVSEVEALLKNYQISDDHPLRKSVNYKQAIGLINNEYSNDEMFNLALYATRQLAKKQITWMRSWKDLHSLSKNKYQKIFNKLKTLERTL
ncbi:tRNA (adenosine(37)-N6)-dimethylallyltransferase MiaA [SAR86 cluster bacterium]|nr:tRNA (adenosine(37)-N6)-dimethylallyltransferase MiaA [SAR86 cluster bacterium]